MKFVNWLTNSSWNKGVWTQGYKICCRTFRNRKRIKIRPKTVSRRSKGVLRSENLKAETTVFLHINSVSILSNTKPKIINDLRNILRKKANEGKFSLSDSYP